MPDQRFGIRARLAQLAEVSTWPAAAGNVPGDPDSDPVARLAAIVGAAVRQHSTHGHASPVMLVHAATAPNAVLRTLPALPRTHWDPSVAAAWAAAAAVTAAYTPKERLAAHHSRTATSIEEVMHRAVDSADAHAIKFADTAIDAYARSSDQALTGEAAHSIELITAN